MNKVDKAFELKPYKNTGHVQWDIYNILRNAFCPYRGIKVITPEISQTELIKNLQFDLYVKVVGLLKGKKIVIAILGRNDKNSNEIASITEKFRLFINSIKEQDADIIIVSPCKFQTHVLNYISEQGLTKKISRYSYDHFKVVVPLGPYCSKHTILSHDEAQLIIDVHRIDPKEMKKIFTYDPQIVWLGAQPNDIILIERFNPLSGISTDLRKVVKAEPHRG